MIIYVSFLVEGIVLFVSCFLFYFPFWERLCISKPCVRSELGAQTHLRSEQERAMMQIQSSDPEKVQK